MPMNAPSPPTNEQAGLARPKANPMPKPKRPLSAFNLFYRFKRQKIVEALAAAAGAAIDKDAIRGVIAAPPGLEGLPASATDFAPPDLVRALRRERILKDLEGNTDPRDTRARSHRKNKDALNGAMSFVELGRVMNASWKGCDPFAKGVFDELSLAGRERYRQRMAEYNARAQGQGLSEEEPAEAKAAPQVPAPALKKLPMKKYIAARAKSSPSPSLNGDASASDDASAVNATAQAMVQLATGLAPTKAQGVPPTNGNNTERSSTKNENRAEAPSLPRRSSFGEAVGNNGAAPTSGGTARAASNPTPRNLPPRHGAPQELLMLQVKRLEVQLAEERLLARARELEASRARVRELEVERARRLLAREAAVPPVLSTDSFLHSELQRLQRTMSERAAVLSRIADLQTLKTLPEVPSKRPSPMISAFSNGIIDFDGRPNKKQRLDSLFAARRGWDF